MNVDNYSLEELCIMYVSFVHNAHDGIYRRKLHNVIAQKMGVEDADLNDIFYNLDRYIGLNLDMEYDFSEYRKMGRKLARVLKSKFNEVNKSK